MPQQLGDSGFAVIDIGSNSVRMVIYDVSTPYPTQTFNEKVYCALGRDLGRTGRLNPDGILSALKAIQGYQFIADSQKVGRVCVVATAAVRDALDGDDFIKQVKKLTDLDIRVLSGDEEATYAAEGVLALDPKAKGVVADFGGGSLELALIENGVVGSTISLPLGAFRIQSMERENQDQKIIELLLAHQDSFGAKPALYGIGGSWRALAQAQMQDIGSNHDIQGYAIPASLLIEFCRKIEDMSVEEIKAQYKLEGQRANLAPVASKVLRIVLQVLGPKIFVTSTAGVRDGMVHEYLSSHLSSEPKKA